MRWIVGLFVLLTVSTASAQKISLALNWKPEPQFGGFYAAQVENIFAQHKLEVELLPGGSGTPTVQMVAAGKVPYAVVSGDELLLARERGADLIALFATYQINPQGIMVHAESDVASLKDVFSQSGILALQRGLPYAEYLFQKYGKSKARVVPYIGGIANFAQNKKYIQQCFVTSEPIAARKQGLKVRTFLIAEAGYNPYTTVVVTQRRTFESRPDETKRLVAAIRKGWELYLKAPGSTHRVMQELNKTMDAETFKLSAKAQLNLIETDDTKKNGLGSMKAERWQELGQQLQKLNVLKKSIDAQKVFVNL